MKVCEFCEEEVPDLQIFREEMGHRICASCYNNLRPIVAKKGTSIVPGVKQ